MTILTEYNLLSHIYTEIRNNLLDVIKTLGINVQTGALSSEDTESSVDGTSLAITIIVTFLVTAIAVGFLGVVVGLVLQTHFNRKKEKKSELSNGYLSSHTTEEKTSL